MPPIICFQTQLGLCPLHWNARHACTMTLTLHLIISLHELEREPIKPVHRSCKLNVCPPSTTSTSRLWTQLSSATRYVKKFFNLLNPSRHGLHSRLEEDEKVCLKTSPQSCPCRSLPHLHFKSRHFIRTKSGNFKKLLVFIAMWQSQTVF